MKFILQISKLFITNSLLYAYRLYNTFGGFQIYRPIAERVFVQMLASECYLKFFFLTITHEHVHIC